MPTQSPPFGDTMTFILNFYIPQSLSEGQRGLGGTKSPPGGHSSCQEPHSEYSSARAAPGLAHAGQLSQLAAELAALSIIIIKN